jgi:CubicO group peptidase (beta-lactamase class C family)
MLSAVVVLSLPVPPTISGVAEQILVASPNVGVWVGCNFGGKTQVGAAGLSDIESRAEAHADQLLSFASISKPVTATIMTEALITAGGSLSTKIVDVNPEWMRVALPEYRSITLEDVLLHRTRLPRSFSNIPIQKSGFPEFRLAQCTELLQQPPRENPEMKELYSNAGYTLFTSAVEQLVHVKFEEVAKQSLRINFGLPSLTFLTEELDQKRRPKTYEQKKGWEFVPPRTIQSLDWQPSGGLKGTMADLIGFGKLFSDALDRDMTGLHSSTAKALTKEAVGRSLGWFIGSFGKSHRYYHHSGMIQGEWSNLIVFPERKWCLGWYRNSSNGAEQDWTGESQSALLDFAFSQKGIRTTQRCDLRISKTEFMSDDMKQSKWPAPTDQKINIHLVLQVTGAQINDCVIKVKLDDQTRKTYWLDGLKPGMHNFYYSFKRPTSNKFSLKFLVDEVGLVNDPDRSNNDKAVEIDLDARQSESTGLGII